MKQMTDEQYVDINGVAKELGLKAQRAKQLVKIYVAAGQLPDRVIKNRAGGGYFYPSSFVQELKRLYEARKAEHAARSHFQEPKPSQTELDLHSDTLLVELANETSVLAFLRQILAETEARAEEKKRRLLAHN